MFQRTLLRQAQAARQVLAASPSTSAPLARRASQFQTRLPTAVRPFAPQPFSRFYSTEKDAAQESESAETEDSSKKELEDKDKQIIELKVRPTLRLSLTHWPGTP